jgi:hypothetical protein
MAAGLALAVIGGAGFGAVSLSGLGAAGGAPAFQEDTGEDAPELNGSGASAPALGPNDRGSRRPQVVSGGASYEPSAAAPAKSPAAESGGGVSRGDESDEPGEGRALFEVDLNEPGPWLAIMAAGVALLLLGLVLRAAISPRAR